jgi:hypothetical protein
MDLVRKNIFFVLERRRMTCTTLTRLRDIELNPMTKRVRFVFEIREQKKKE